MRRRMGVAASLLLALAVGCSSDDSAGPITPTTTTVGVVAAPTTVAVSTSTVTSAPAAGAVTLRATDVRLTNSEESDNAFRALVDAAGAEVTVVLTGVPSPNRVVFVCPASELERRVAAPGCITPAGGEAVKVALPSGGRGVEVVQVGVAGSGPAANSTAVGEIAITYRPTSREVRLRLPPLRQGEAGGAPAFRLSPVGPGSYRAIANWAPGPGTAAEVTMTVGANVSRHEGSPGALINGSVSPPVEGTLRLRNTGSTTLTGVTITALFP